MQFTIAPQPDSLDSDDDNEGLSNAVEAEPGASQLDSDTDDGSLTDGEAVNYSHEPPDTDTQGNDPHPLVPDTGGQGAVDGNEVIAGTDPLDISSTPVPGDVTLDGEADILLAEQALLGVITLRDEQAFRANSCRSRAGCRRPAGHPANGTGSL